LGLQHWHRILATNYPDKQMKNRQTLLLTCVLLAACGQTGPLYLPEPEVAPEPVTTPEQEPDTKSAPDT